jgi:MFS family permease
MGKTILSVVAGYFTWTVVFLGGSFGLRLLLTRVEFDAEGFTDNVTALGLFLATSMLASLLAGYVAGWLADGKHLKHGLILLFCLLATGIPVQMSAWDKLPLWYNLAFLILLTPMTLLGINFSGGDAPAGKVIR